MAKKYKRKTVKKFTVQLPALDKSGNAFDEKGKRNTKPVRLPLPTRGTRLSEDQKKQFVEAFIQLYLLPENNMTTTCDQMAVQRCTIHAWRTTSEEIDKMISDAIVEKKLNRRSQEEETAKSMAQKLMEGYKVDLEKRKVLRMVNKKGDIEYVEAEKTINQVYVKPSEALVMRKLENTDESWVKGAGEIAAGKTSIPLISWVDDEEE